MREDSEGLVADEGATDPLPSLFPANLLGAAVVWGGQTAISGDAESVHIRV
jgi:hypothetical protein